MDLTLVLCQLFLAEFGHPMTVDTLLQGGANIKATDQQGRTALDLAKERDHPAVVELLEKFLHTQSEGVSADSDDEGTSEVEAINITAEVKPEQTTPSDMVQTAEDISRQIFMVHEKKKLSSCKVFALITVGKTMAGKTSLVKTLIEGKSHLAPHDKRTVVAAVLRWLPTQKKDTVFLVYDLGGQNSYRATCCCFQMNSPSSVCILVHEIKSSDYKDTFEWLKVIQTNAPESKVLVVLTKSDTEKDEAKMKRLVKDFVENFVKLLNSETEIVKVEEKNAEGAKKRMYAKHIRNYEAVKSQLIDNKVFLLSSAPLHEHTVSDLRDYLLDFADSTDDAEVMLPELDKELFIEIGTLGLREPLLQQPDEPLNSPETKRRFSIEHQLGEREVSQSPQDAEEETERPVMEQVEVKAQQYLTISEIAEVYKDIAERLGKTVINPLAESKVIVTNLSNKGLLRYFSGDKHLEEIVFNNIATLVAILGSIFHLQPRNMLTFSRLEYSLKYELYQNKEKKFEHDVDELHKFGIVTRSMLQVLLNTINCSIDVNAVAELLERLDVGINFKEEAAISEMTLVPFLSDKHLPQEHLQDQVARGSEKTLTLHTVLKGKLMEYFFHMLLVKLYRKFGRNQKNDKRNQSWRNCAFISLRKTVKFMMYHEKDGPIEFIIQGDISKKCDHDFMFDCIRFVDQAYKEIQKSRYPGLVVDFVLRCTNCELVSGIRYGDQARVAYEWDVEHLLEEPESYYRCPTCEGDIHDGLLAPIPKDLSIEEQEKKLEDLIKYLKDKHKDKVQSKSSPKARHHTPNLKDDCLQRIVRKTIHSDDFIKILACLGRDFCFYLSYNIISKDMQQQIQKAATDSEAVYFIRQALDGCLDPNMIDALLIVLYKEELGKQQHAEQIKVVYHRHIDEHQWNSQCGR